MITPTLNDILATCVAVTVPLAVVVVRRRACVNGRGPWRGTGAIGDRLAHMAVDLERTRQESAAAAPSSSSPEASHGAGRLGLGDPGDDTGTESSVPGLRAAELALPLSVRLARLARRPLARVVSRPSTSARLERTRLLLLQAGSPLDGQLSPGDFMTLRILSTIAGALALASFLSLLVGGPLALIFGGAAGATGGSLLPVRWLRRRRARRVRALTRDLADYLDIIVSIVAAGVSWDAAIGHLVHRAAPSALRDELDLYLAHRRIGITVMAALMGVEQRTAVQEIVHIRTVVVQAQALDAGELGRHLSAAVTDLRRRQRDHARYKAAQVRVKMLIPLITCIFPATFVVILGPAGRAILAVIHH